jgi:plastocyanin
MVKFASALLIVASLVPLSDARAQTAVSLNITLTNYAFAPSTLNLKAGVTYHIHFTNDGSKDHNFSAPEFFAASQIAPDAKPNVKNGLVALDSGQSIDITVTPIRPGTFSVECTHFMHKMMGMHGNIDVQ